MSTDRTEVAPAPAARRSVPPSAAAQAGRHRAVRVVAVVLGGLLTLAIVGGASLAAANLLVRATERDSRTVEGTITRARVVVEGSATIVAGPDGQARVDRTSTFGLSRPDITETLVDGLLTVRITCVGGVICTNRVTLTLPAATDVTVSAGDLRVSDITGPVEVDTDGGKVRLDGLSGPIDARVGGGEVLGTDLTSQEVRARVGGGHIALRFRTPPREVDAFSAAGAVEVILPRGEEAYRCRRRRRGREPGRPGPDRSGQRPAHPGRHRGRGGRGPLREPDLSALRASAPAAAAGGRRSGRWGG